MVNLSICLYIESISSYIIHVCIYIYIHITRYVYHTHIYIYKYTTIYIYIYIIYMYIYNIGFRVIGYNLSCTRGADLLRACGSHLQVLPSSRSHRWLTRAAVLSSPAARPKFLQLCFSKGRLRVHGICMVFLFDFSGMLMGFLMKFLLDVYGI